MREPSDHVTRRDETVDCLERTFIHVRNSIDLSNSNERRFIARQARESTICTGALQSLTLFFHLKGDVARNLRSCLRVHR